MYTLNITNGDIILEFIYLVSALLFVVGLKLLSSPDSARKGNLWAAGGMILAMIGTLALHRDVAGNTIRGANLAIILSQLLSVHQPFSDRQRATFDLTFDYTILQSMATTTNTATTKDTATTSTI